jgi:drug/metabolite transporter (DMT)-like permease
VNERARRLAGIAAALVAVSVWGGWIPVTRLGLVTRIAPEDVAALRYGCAALLLAPVLWLRWRAIPWRRGWVLSILVLGAGIPYFLLFTHGLALANSGQAAILGPGASSALTAILAITLLGERLQPAQWAGLALTLAGIVLLVAHDGLQGGAGLAGFALILAASLAWAAYTVAGRTLALSPVLNAALVAVPNGAVYVPVYLARGGGAHLSALPLGALALQLVYQGLLAAVVALIAYAYAVQRLGAATAAGYTPLAPVLAALLGWLLVGDPLSGTTLAGLAAVTLGVLIAGRAAAFTARR